MSFRTVKRAEGCFGLNVNGLKEKTSQSHNSRCPLLRDLEQDINVVQIITNVVRIEFSNRDFLKLHKLVNALGHLFCEIEYLAFINCLDKTMSCIEIAQIFLYIFPRK